MIRHDLEDWIVEALRRSRGQASVVEISKFIWDHHEQELRASGDLFYTWQYDMRWAGQRLRNSGKLVPAGSMARPFDPSVLMEPHKLSRRILSVGCRGLSAEAIAAM